MTKAQHTPGPWYWGKDPKGRFSEPYLLAGDGTVICHFGDDEEYYPTEGDIPSEANARVIAAAPDLLAYAECMEAFNAWAYHKGGNAPNYFAVYLQHGWNPSAETDIDFLNRIRKEALAKAKGGAE